MGHKSSKFWKENLSNAQKKYLLNEHASFWQKTMTGIDGFSNNELDRFKKLYENDPNFNSLGQSQGPNISDFKFDKLV